MILILLHEYCDQMFDLFHLMDKLCTIFVCDFALYP
jgi:hypothetical protein